MNLSPDDAMELGQLLQFLDDWIATDREQFGISLARFIGIDGYGLETLRDDLARFMFLLGETDGERLFSPRAAELDRTTVAGHVRSRTTPRLTNESRYPRAIARCEYRAA